MGGEGGVTVSEMGRHMATLAREGSELRTLIKWLLDASQHKMDCRMGVVLTDGILDAKGCDCGAAMNMRDARLAASKYLRGEGAK